MAHDSDSFISFGKENYFIPFGSKIGCLPPHLVARLARFSEDIIPTTVIEWSEKPFGPTDLETICKHFQDADDVWSSSFLSRESLHEPSIP